jgi:hypothetical protein
VIVATKKSTAKAEKATAQTEQGGELDELVTPEEHAETTETVEPDEHVSDPGVPDDVEVAARSADMDKPSTEHRKVFVLGPNSVDNSTNPYTEAHDYDHEPNKAATRQYAIDQGMWPTGDVRHVSTKRHPDGVSWVLTYAVDVIPANDAPDGSQTPRVVAEDGDAEGATNYMPPSAVEAHDDNTEPAA